MILKLEKLLRTWLRINADWRDRKNMNLLFRRLLAYLFGISIQNHFRNTCYLGYTRITRVLSEYLQTCTIFSNANTTPHLCFHYVKRSFELCYAPMSCPAILLRIYRVSQKSGTSTFRTLRYSNSYYFHFAR